MHCAALTIDAMQKATSTLGGKGSYNAGRHGAGGEHPWHQHTWFTMTRLQGMLSRCSALRRRELSLMPRTVGMVAIMNSVVVGSVKMRFTSWMRSLSSSSRSTTSSWLLPVPNSPRMADVALLSFVRSLYQGCSRVEANLQVRARANPQLISNMQQSPI
jgi:hypothetical protein